MKICVTSTGNNKNSEIDLRFGRCSYFAVIDDEAQSFEFVSNPGINSVQGAGITSAQKVIDLKVDTVLTGNIGPNAMKLLKGSDVKIYSLNGGNVEEALSSFKEKGLSEITNPGPAHFGMGNGQRKG